MKSRILTLFLLVNLAVLPKLFSQNVAINATGNAPDASAMLDISSTSKGFLMPRMSTAQRDAITLPATGLTIFNTSILSYQVNVGTASTPVWSTLGSSSFISSLNGLTTSSQTFATATLGTAPSWGSSGSVHTLRIPLASTATVTAGLLSNADYNAFNNKLSESRVISTTSPLQGGGDLSVDRTFSISNAAADGTTKGAAAFTASDFSSASGVISIDYTNGRSASASNKGFLTSADWTSFNNKLSSVDTSNITNFGGKVQSLFSGSAPITYSNGLIGITQASTSTDGYLSSSDWNTFNNKLTAIDTGNIADFYLKSRALLSAGSGISYDNVTGVIANTGVTSFNGTTGDVTLPTGDLSETGSSVLSITGGTGAVLGTGTTLEVKQANGSQNGFLSSADWTTFNNKLASIDTSNIANFGVKVQSLFSGSAPITYSNGLIGITQATTSTNGYLSSADWNTFNGKADTANTWKIGGNGVASVQNIGTTSNFALPFITNSTEKMRLSAGGNLGIGASVVDGTNAEKLLVNADTTSYNVISGKGDLNSYLQLNIKNINAGTAASSDIVATNDVGTEANGLNYVDLGVNSSGNTSTGILGGPNTGYLYSTGNDFSIGNATASKSLLLFTGGTASANERMRIDGNGNVGIGVTSPTSLLHLKAGSTSANTAPLKFTSGSLMTTAEAGGVEFLTDKFYGTITTGAARKEFTLNDAGLTSGRIPFATTNGRLTDLSTFTYNTNRLSPTYITLGAGTATAGTAPLVFTSGTNLTTPIAGAMEFDGTHFYGTVGSTRYQLDQQSANAWSTIGNSGTSHLTNFIGTTDNKSLRFRTNSIERMIVDSIGRVGIGSSAFDATTPERLLVDGGTSVNNIINAIGDQNSYVQIGVQNKNNGANASSDIVATNNYTASGLYPYYVDMGINSAGYSNNSANILNQPHTAYIYSVSPQDFYIGNGSANKGLVFFTYGGNTSNGNNSADGTERIRITSNGNIGIGDFSSPNNSGVNNPTNFLVTVKGTIAPYATSGGGSGDLGASSNRWGTVYASNALNTSSDMRLKTNITDLTYGLKEVMAMQPVSYNWKTTPDTDKKLGLIAQEVRKIIPEVVKGDETKETLSMAYTELIPVLINAIKEQQQQIDSLKKDIELLKNK